MDRAPLVPTPLPRVNVEPRTLARQARTPWNSAGLAAAQPVAESLLGARLEVVTLEPPRLCTLGDTLAAVPAHAVGFVLGPEPDRSAAPLWLALEPAGAGLWVDRLLGGDGLEAPVPVALPLDAMSHGVLGYLVARVLAAHGGGLRLQALGGEPSAEQRGTLGVRHTATLSCAGAACEVRLWSELPVGATHPGATQLAAEGRAAALELTLVADAGAVTLCSAELGALARGDVVLLDRLELTRDAAAAWRGQARLHAAEGGTGAILCSVQEGTLVVEAFEPRKEPHMTQGRRIPSAEVAPALAALADVPVQLSLELGRFAVTLQELSALRAGDVLASGLQVGQRVALRAGSQLVATGELVELDGELGVRIEQLAD